MWTSVNINIAAAAAKSLHSCLTLCNPIDGSPPGSPVPGILQARTLEWVAKSSQKSWAVIIISILLKRKLKDFKITYKDSLISNPLNNDLLSTPEEPGSVMSTLYPMVKQLDISPFFMAAIWDVSYRQESSHVYLTDFLCLNWMWRWLSFGSNYNTNTSS